MRSIYWDLRKKKTCPVVFTAGSLISLTRSKESQNVKIFTRSSLARETNVNKHRQYRSASRNFRNRHFKCSFQEIKNMIKNKGTFLQDHFQNTPSPLCKSVGSEQTLNLSDRRACFFVALKSAVRHTKMKILPSIIQEILLKQSN